MQTIKKLPISVLMCLFFHLSNGQLVVKLDGEVITPQHTYNYFFCPGNITIAHQDYDSLWVEKVVVNYHDLKEDKGVSRVFRNDTIDINPYGILTAAVSAKSLPIVIEIDRIYGFIEGKKNNLEIKDKVFTINYGSAKFKEEAMFSKINSGSKLRMFIGDSLVKANYVLLSDSASTWKLQTPEGTSISHGMVLTLKIFPKGAAAPTRQINFDSEESLYKEIRKLMKAIQPGDVIFFKEMYLKKQDGSVSVKPEALVYEVK